MLGNYPEALKYLLDALKIREQIANKKDICETEHHIGAVHYYLEDYTEALKYNQSVLKERIVLGDRLGAAGSHTNIGVLFFVQRNYSKALEHHLASLNLSKEIDDKDGIATAYANIGIVKTEEKNFNESLDNLFTALKIFESIGSKQEVAMIYDNIGINYTRQKKFDDAMYYLNASLSLAKQIGSLDDIKEAYKDLSILDSTMGNYQKAFEHYKQSISYRDSLLNEENSKKVVQLQMQYEFDKKEDSLHQKQLITQTKLDSQQSQKKFYLGGSVLLGLLSLFVYLNFRNQKKINRLADDTHAKEKAELELQSLRAQLNPHFMFNSLNAIQELILKEENEKSQSYLARFAKLLRLLLENADKPFIPLQREIDFLQLYLSLENLRIPDLQFSINVDGSVDTERTMIPNMILQPYIENAIWHGLSHKENDKQLRIRINQSNGTTYYEIEDNGVGRKKAAELKSLYRKEHKSKGMELLSKRFKLLAKEYGSAIETLVSDITSNGNIIGTLITIKVPFTISINS